MHSTLSKIVFVKYTLHNHPLPLVSVTFCLNIKHSAFWDAPYTSICSATRSRTFSRHYWFTLSLALHSQSHYRGRPSSSFCSLCLIWAAFYSPPVSLEVNRREKVGEKKKKTEMKENASNVLTCVALSFSMVAWAPLKQPIVLHCTLKEVQGRGRARKGVKEREGVQIKKTANRSGVQGSKRNTWLYRLSLLLLCFVPAQISSLPARKQFKSCLLTDVHESVHSFKDN